MDKRSEFEMTNEKRSLLNTGHGPPVLQELPMAFGFYSNPANAPTSSMFHRNATCSDFGSRVLASPGFYGDCRYQPTLTSNRPEITDEQILMRKINDQDLLLQNLCKEFRLMQASNDDLARENDALRRQQTTTMVDLDALKAKHRDDHAKYQHLTRLLTSLPDAPIRLPGTRASDDFIHLVASEEFAGEDNTPDKQLELDDQAAMMKSIQCSESSVEQATDGKEEVKETEIASPSIQKKGRGVSSPASSASFEVVRQGSRSGSPVEGEDMKMALMSLKTEYTALKSEFDELSRNLEAEREERKRETAELKERVDQIIQKGEKDNDKALEVTPRDRQSEDQTQNVSELMSANWKLTEQNVELTRENEDLKKKELERRSEVANLQEKLLRKQRQVTDAEEELESQRQHVQFLEARIRETEDMPLTESFMQQGMARNGSSGDLATENALLKHQIEAYKEDFEVERKDRENLVAQKDTLQQGFDTLRSDLDVARQQVKKFEHDITLLRIDNNTLRTRLRAVTEEMDALKEGRQFTTSASKPAAQNRTLVPKPVPQNSFAQRKPSPPPSGQSGDWECQACTYKNPVPRTFCEMCGTHEPLRMPLAAQVPNCGYDPNIPVREMPPVQRNTAQPGMPLLSNLRNYGDIETD